MLKENYQIYLGDCLDVMDSIIKSSVDLILADLPYGTTGCEWDSPIPLEPLWGQYKRVLKKKGCTVLTSIQPFTSTLVMSNLEWFSYDLVWDKVSLTGFLDSNNKPLRQHESILVFSEVKQTYNPQMSKGTPYFHSGKRSPGGESVTDDKKALSYVKEINNKGERYPTSIVKFNKERGLHPTQKPVPLLEYLILTYTNEGDTVLDNTMGSGSTGEACLRTGRKFIGIEKDPEYFEIARERLETVSLTGSKYKKTDEEVPVNMNIW